MPYCTQCGNQVAPSDVFCGSCGTRQQEASAGETRSTGFGAGTASFGPQASAGAGDKARGTFESTADSFSSSMTPKQASVFCYIPWVGWIASIVVLASNRFRDDKDVRFHAFQGLYLFVLWLFVDWVFPGFFYGIDGMRTAGKLMKLGVVVGWILMLVKTSQGQMLRLPVIGELAERSASEQR